MANNVIDVRLQSAYKTATEWTTANPVLGLGEVGYEIDSGGLFKIGNGTSTWNQLPYSNHRPLTNNDFDTANITDANVGNLVVTGVARFLNVIQGTANQAGQTTGTLTITQNGTTQGTFNGAPTTIALTDNNTTYKFASSTSGATGAIIGLKSNGASTFDTDSTVSLATTSIAYPIINALTTGSTQATTADYLIGSYAGAGTPTTSWWRKQGKLIAVGRAVGDESGNNIKSSYASSVTTADGAKIILKSKAAGNLANVSIATTGFTNPMLDALGNGTSAASLTTPIITGYAGTVASSANTYWKRPASLVMVGSAASATNSEQLGGHTSAYFIGTGSTVSSMTTAGGTKLPNETAVSDYVADRIADLGKPMHYKGTVTTASGLPTSNISIGDTYLVAETGVYISGTTAYEGDLYVYSPSSAWDYIPSANDDCVKSVDSGNSWITTGGSASAVTISHADPQTSSGSVGPTGNTASSAIWGQSITVPYLAFDSKGHITNTANRTVTFPANPNTDEKLKMTPASVTKFYPAGNPNSTSAVTTAYYSTAVSITGSTVSAGTFSGKLVHANVANSGSAGGISLYSTVVNDYGIAMRDTGDGGKHGGVQGGWAIYNYMAGATDRGFIWKNSSTAVASIDCAGNEVLNGSLTVGGSSANDTGCKLQYNSTTKSLDFIFV